MILVIGATGTVGSAVLSRLSALDVPVRALVRPRPDGPPGPGSGALPVHRVEPVGAPRVQVVHGDAADPESLRLAMAGVDRVFLAMANGPRQVAIETGIVRAAASAGVDHLAKVSAPVVGPDVPVAVGRGHHAVEQEVLASGMGHTFLRPYAFMQNLLSHAPAIRRSGSFSGTTGSTPMNMVDARDVADVAVAALTGPGDVGRVHVLTGPEAVSYPEVARRLSALGREVRYVDRSPADLRDELLTAGLPGWLASHILEIQALAVSTPERPNGTVAAVTGRPPRHLDAFLAEHAGRFQPAGSAASTSEVVADVGRPLAPAKGTVLATTSAAATVRAARDAG